MTTRRRAARARSAQRRTALLGEALPAPRARPSAPPPPPADVAIVGMACIFPGAPDTDDVLGEHRRRRSTPSPRSPPSAGTRGSTTTPTRRARDKTPSQVGRLPRPTSPSTRSRYGIPPRSLAAIEPVQLLALEVARGARCADAGYADAPVRPRADLGDLRRRGRHRPVGAYGFRAAASRSSSAARSRAPERSTSTLPELTEDSFPGVLTNVIAGRIANRLDLGGVELHRRRRLRLVAGGASTWRSRSCGRAPATWCSCGGADTAQQHQRLPVFAERARPVADGPVPHVRRRRRRHRARRRRRLRRAQAAGRRRARRRPHLRGDQGRRRRRATAATSGLTAPRAGGPDARARARLRAGRRVAGRRSGWSRRTAPARWSATGPSCTALTERLRRRRRAAPAACALGSVKSQIGHTKCAAGMAGLIKAALALHHGVLPPTLHVDEPNPGRHAEQPVLRRQRAAAVAARRAGASAARGVSAFGFGGTNFHAVLSEYDGAYLEPRRRRRAALAGRAAGLARVRTRRLTATLDRLAA